ncbi:MAG: thioesterase [Acidimicrobiaceae bacterium]|nr:thioesterase [Acidimicrobiaceae bacterium]
MRNKPEKTDVKTVETVCSSQPRTDTGATVIKADTGATVITPQPTVGRVFKTTRRVRFSDISSDKKIRLDALAGYLQDISRDDSADAEYPQPIDWLVRRTLIQITTLPRFHERLNLSTWCSGLGKRWAERRTKIRGDQGSLVDAVSLWIHVDPTTGIPRRLPDNFYKIWGTSAKGRKVSARLLLPTTIPAHSRRLPWSMRYSDLDMLNHANNAAHWSALMEAVTYLKHSPNTSDEQQTTTSKATRTSDHDLNHNSNGQAAAIRQTIRGEIEYIAPIEMHHQIMLQAVCSATSSETTAWLLIGENLASVARFTRTPSQTIPQ